MRNGHKLCWGTLTTAIRSGREQVVIVFSREGCPWCEKQLPVVHRAMQRRAGGSLTSEGAVGDNPSGNFFLLSCATMCFQKSHEVGDVVAVREHSRCQIFLKDPSKFATLVSSPLASLLLCVLTLVALFPVLDRFVLSHTPDPSLTSSLALPRDARVIVWRWGLCGQGEGCLWVWAWSGFRSEGWEQGWSEVEDEGCGGKGGRD